MFYLVLMLSEIPFIVLYLVLCCSIWQNAKVAEVCCRYFLHYSLSYVITLQGDITFVHHRWEQCSSFGFVECVGHVVTDKRLYGWIFPVWLQILIGYILLFIINICFYRTGWVNAGCSWNSSSAQKAEETLASEHYWFFIALALCK